MISCEKKLIQNGGRGATFSNNHKEKISSRYSPLQVVTSNWRILPKYRRMGENKLRKKRRPFRDSKGTIHWHSGEEAQDQSPLRPSRRCMEVTVDEEQDRAS